jgi:hypothetical protein
MREASAASLILDGFGRDERTRTADPCLQSTPCARL